LLALVIGADTVGFDIPGIRQAIAFIYLTFIPGLLIFRLLKLNRLDAVETLLYSAGISIATVMLLGFSMNLLYPLIGIARPISTMPLVITMTICVAIMSSLIYFRERKEKLSLPKIRLPSKSEIFSPPVLFLLLLPLLSVLGTYVVNSYNQNSLLLILIGLIALTAGLVAFNKFIPPKLYPMAIAVMAISLLWHRSLISQYLIGDDIHTEYLFQNMVLANSRWNMALPSDVNAMLSITMLGPVYSMMLNVDVIWIDKIIHPLLFTLVPLALFQIYRKQTDDRTAFLAAFFFISFAAFFVDMLELVRQQVAEIFFALTILMFFDRDITLVKKSALLILFGFSIVVSHYGLSYLYMLYLIISLGLLFLARSRAIAKLWHITDTGHKQRKGNTVAVQPTVSAAAIPAINGFTTSFVMLIFVFGLGWYMFISTGSHTFNAIIDIGRHLYINLSDFFVEESRDPSVLMAVGRTSLEVVSAPRQLFLIIQYITQFFIVIGVAGTLLNLRRTRFQPAYVALTLVSALLLLMCIVIPYFTKFMGVSRIYHVTLLLLAPFCISGGILVFKNLFRLWPNKLAHTVWDTLYVKLIVLFVTIPYFLFYTGFIYALSGDTQTSIALAPNRFSHAITFVQDIYGVKWLSELDPIASIKDDDHGNKIVVKYGLAPRFQTMVFNPLNLDTIDTRFIFLTYGNIAKDEIWLFSFTEKERIYEPVSLNNGTLFERNNRIFDNGAVIYATRPIPEE